MSVRAGTDFYKTEKSVRRGVEAFNEMDCDNKDGTTILTCMAAGGVIGAISTLPVGGAGAGIGIGVGFGVGMAIVGVRKAIRNDECTIL